MSEGHDALIALIKGLHEKVDGVNVRLDKLNGRVYAHEIHKADRADINHAKKILREEIREVKGDTKENRSIIWKITIVISGLLGLEQAIKYLL